jgi:uncharacterized membrane protein YoaK (UPF0700 family)
MEEKSNKIWFVTLVLTLIAGYCDALTFVAAEKIFSAHVTGNFIVFAYQLVNGSDADAWVKLLTFPVFMLAVMIGGMFVARFANKHLLLFCEGLVLLLAGILAYILNELNGFTLSWAMYAVTMLVVFAMGLQNAFGKLFVKDTFGPTTMMTGNVTQFSLDLSSCLSSGFTNKVSLVALKNGLVTLGGFLLGCFLGAFVGKQLGLTGIIFPGIAMICCYFYSRSQNSETLLKTDTAANSGKL